MQKDKNNFSDRHIYTVSQITQDIKLILESSFPEVWIEAEVSNFKAYPSGHFYFTLKDDASILSAVMFSRANKDLKFRIENGLKVVCFGKISLYGPYGQYQLIIEKVEPKGIGGLQLALEQLKLKLSKEGLFAKEHKRPIPYLPAHIGVVTSFSGAAIKDILKVVDRRFSDVHIVICSAQVQGEAAKEEIARAIEAMNAYNELLTATEKIEVMIVGRGGGSVEDLWAFNEEMVARAIYNSKIPIISAVGHEQDWTISDLVADLRAPTPSVAAELVVPEKEELKQKVGEVMQALRSSLAGIAAGFESEIENLTHRLALTMEHILTLNTAGLEAARNKLALLNPVALIEQYLIKTNDLSRQIYVRMQHLLKMRQAGFNTAVEKLSSLSPLNILSRGYSITFSLPEGAIIKDAGRLKVADKIKTRLHKGEITSEITEVN